MRLTFSALVMTFAMSAAAAPFIVADPQEDADSFNIRYNDGSTEPAGLQVLTGGLVRLKHDIGSLTPGTYTVEVQACASDAITFTGDSGIPVTVSGCSSWAGPYHLEKRPLNGSSGMSLEE